MLIRKHFFAILVSIQVDVSDWGAFSQCQRMAANSSSWLNKQSKAEDGGMRVYMFD